MSKIVIYRKSNGEFVFDGYVTPAGTWRKKEETSPGSINFREVGALADRFPQSIYITDVVNESGTPYATIAAFDAEMDGFFVKAPGGGTGASDFLGGIVHDGPAPTPGVSGKYYFITEGVCVWLPDSPYVQPGDEALVIYEDTEYQYIFRPTLAHDLMVYYDEDDDSVTVAVADSIIVSETTSPEGYDEITLTLQ